jgi:alkylhydroperoxidase family enzyme
MRREPVDDALFETLRGHFGNDGMVTLTVLIGYYSCLATALVNFKVPLDDKDRPVQPFVTRR